MRFIMENCRDKLWETAQYLNWIEKREAYSEQVQKCVSCQDDSCEVRPRTPKEKKNLLFHFREDPEVKDVAERVTEHLLSGTRAVMEVVKDGAISKETMNRAFEAVGSGCKNVAVGNERFRAGVMEEVYLAQ